MTKRLFIVLTSLLLLVPFNVSAQDEEVYELLTEHEIGECPQLILNTELLLPRLNDESKFDSIYIILEFVEQRCGPEHFADYDILHRIEMGDYPEDYCESFLLREILSDSDLPLRYWEEDDSYAGALDLSLFEFSPYKKFLRSLAESLAARTDTNSVAHLICRHYMRDHDHIMRRLKRNEFEGTCLQNEYDREIDRVYQELRGLRTYLVGGIGVWVPAGKADLLGPKLEISADVGLRKGLFGFDITGAVRLLESNEFYELYYNERIVRTDDFVGGYIGGTLSGQVLSLRRYNLEILAGAGYDGFTSTTGDDGYTVDSYNLNFGLRLMYLFNEERNRFGALQLKYNVVDYDTGGGTDLSGNTISLNIVYGYLGNRNVTPKAKHLRYYP